jgi:hypothetical protein
MLQIPAGPVIDAAQALKLAGRWALAGQLLAAASAGTPAERAAVGMARATIAADADFWHQRASAEAESATAETISFITEAAGAGADLTVLRYDVDMLTLQRDYSTDRLWAAPPGLRQRPGRPGRAGPRAVAAGDRAAPAGRVRAAHPRPATAGG